MVLENLADANAGTGANAGTDAGRGGYTSGDLSGVAGDRGKRQRPQDSKIIATTALVMLCYARNDLSNILQLWILSRTI